MSILTGRRAELAELYWASGSVQFGTFRLASHRKEPNLPPSPIYLHYPTEGYGTRLLLRIYGLVGELLHELVLELGLEFDRIGPVPKGANPLGMALAAYWDKWLLNLILFGKDEVDGQSHFYVDSGKPNPGEIILGVEDHTSGGYTKERFIAAVLEAQLFLRDFLSVVDREQGAEGFLASIDVAFHSLFKLTTDLVPYYVQKGHINTAKADETLLYIAENQLWKPS